MVGNGDHGDDENDGDDDHDHDDDCSCDWAGGAGCCFCALIACVIFLVIMTFATMFVIIFLSILSEASSTHHKTFGSCQGTEVRAAAGIEAPCQQSWLRLSEEGAFGKLL